MKTKKLMAIVVLFCLLAPAAYADTAEVVILYQSDKVTVYSDTELVNGWIDDVRDFGKKVAILVEMVIDQYQSEQPPEPAVSGGGGGGGAG